MVSYVGMLFIDKIRSREAAMTKKRFLIQCTLVLLCTTIAGRLLGLFYGESATNILYANWISVVLGYAEDLLGCLRTTYLFCSIAYGYWVFGLSYSNRHFLLSTGLILIDMLSRLAVDLLQNNISELVTVAVIWLALQMAYELMLCVLAWITAQLVLHLHKTSSHPRAKDRHTLATALRLSLLWQFLSRVGMEGYNILSFTSSYTDITSAEISSMVGYLLYAVILYGGIAFLAEEGLRTLWVSRTWAVAA